MRNIGILKNLNLVLAVLISVSSCTGKKTVSPVDYVDPFIGACTSAEAAGVYHGIVQVSPQTITGGDNSCGYSNEMTSIEGFSFTQMSGVGWFGDLGNFLVMPTVGSMHTIAGKADGSISGWRSSFDKADEAAEPGWDKVRLAD